MAENTVEETRRGRPLLEVDDVAVHFGGVKAVDGITLELRAGHIYGVLGPNGSGKSTLLGAMTRLTPMTRGSFVFEGNDYTRRPARTVHHMGIARTFQTVRLLDDRSVRDNILLGQDTLAKAGRKDADARVDEVMERVGVTAVARMRPDELSYGMQRRVEFARAIIGRPRLLLLDEPTAGMNSSEREEIGALMKQLLDEGITQFIVEHDVQMMVDTCDYLFAMNFGKLIAEGTPAAVVKHPAVQEAYLGKGAGTHA
ncbi:ABC transporter ATP-binding protein [Nocardioides soli]|uniref:ABC-type branched-subunit amino acid transport system ATPase component n=1 Tax=Nocardioides soli TaxID=1036020 RepID=A0A7W4VX94_9ACTN|nr:ABC transporter ATP-binding protein [Nocardioides soli]MBB3043183.1 ABC-type branched-subunit amino acid transport system ATPase component [Nocardioides soli]